MKIALVASMFQYYSLQKTQTFCVVSTPSDIVNPHCTLLSSYTRDSALMQG